MADDALDRTTRLVILGLIVFFAGLIGLVIVVAIFQGTLNPVAMATILSGIFTGVLAALGWTVSNRNNKPQEKSDA